MHEFQYENIGEVRKFDADDYPKMVAELTVVLDDLVHIPIYFKRDIIVSYLKDHSIKTEWINANPKLATLMTSGSLATRHLETLFEACRWNKTFRVDFERYIKARVN